MSVASSKRVVIPSWAQGRPEMGQGGYSAGQFQKVIEEPVAVNFRAPIPLETPMSVTRTESGWDLRCPNDDGSDRLIMDAVPTAEVVAEFAVTEAVTPDVAERARANFTATTIEDHAAWRCFSCGLNDDTMKVHPGLLDGETARMASDWTPPDWTAADDGFVDRAVVWTVMDCAQGFHVGRVPERRDAVTARYTAEIVAPIEAGRRYSVVAFDGNGSGQWEGRKRVAGANIFDDEGTLVARSDSLWIATS